MTSSQHSLTRSKTLLMAIVVGITLIVGLGIPATRSVEALNQPETDTLAAGAHLAGTLSGDATLGKRLKAGFDGTPGNPRSSRFKGNASWMKKAVEPPLPRWVAGLAMAAGADPAEADGDTWSGLDLARSAAAFVLGLALALLFGYVAVVARRRRDDGYAFWTASATVGLALLVPGLVDAGTGAGYGSILFLCSMLLIISTHRAAVGGSGVWAGIAWGLCLACHGSALFFIVPIFAAIAAAHLQRQRALSPNPHAPSEPPMPPGHLRLPAVALTGFAIPLLGVITLAVVWPSLWQDSAKTLAVWLTDAYRMMEPEQQVGGFAFGQSSSKVPSGWVTLLQAVAWMPVIAVALWFWGLISSTRRAATHWFPLMYLATLLVIGMTAGGLFFGRQSLLPMLWAPVLVTGAYGVRALLEAAAERFGTTWGVHAAAAAVVVVLTAGVQAIVPTGAPPGAGILQPLPVSMLERVATKEGTTQVAVVGGAAGWGRPLSVVAKHAGLPIRAAAIHRADWVLVVQDERVIESTNPNWLKTLPKGEPVMIERAGGLTFQAFER